MAPATLEPRTPTLVTDEIMSTAAGTYSGRASDIELDWSVAYAYTIRNQKIVRMELYGSRENALQAAGLAGQG